jgi:cytochrome c553
MMWMPLTGLLMKNNKFYFLCVTANIALVLVAPMSGWAAEGADGQAGKAKAIQCFTCHGSDGLSKVPDAPNLAGQNETYLVKALNDYKSGARKHEVMSMMAQNLSATDIAQVAAYFSSIPIVVKAP